MTELLEGERIRFPEVVDCGAWFDGLPEAPLLDFSDTDTFHASAFERIDELTERGPVRFVAPGPLLDRFLRRFGRRIRSGWHLDPTTGAPHREWTIL